MIDEGCLDQTILKPSVAFLRIGQCLSCWDLESIWCFIVSVGANCNQGNLKRSPTSATKGAKKQRMLFFRRYAFDLLPFYSTKIKTNEITTWAPSHWEELGLQCKTMLGLMLKDVHLRTNESVSREFACGGRQHVLQHVRPFPPVDGWA
jgi:hypothetical protein